MSTSFPFLSYILYAFSPVTNFSKDSGKNPLTKSQTDNDILNDVPRHEFGMLPAKDISGSQFQTFVPFLQLADCVCGNDCFGGGYVFC